MSKNPIALAIPFFLLAIAVEIVVARARGRRIYRLRDSLADLGCGVAQQVALVLGGAALLAAYDAVYRHAALWRFADGSPWPWLIAFVVVDFAYYWWHRLSHEVSFLWAVHAVHHQSEEYNLSVALRQAVLSTATTLPFYAPMALLGVPTLAYATMVSISTLYQFWIHTELVGRLGPVELVLNTPSHHRVHHAINPRYLDRNYGAISIVWDRLFGTFAEERERPVYGVTKALGSFSPLWAQAQPWAEIAARGRSLRGLDRLRVWWRSPGWSPEGAPVPSEVEVQARAKHEPPLTLGIQVYALVQFAPLVAATFVMLLWQQTARPVALAIAAGLVFWTLLTVGGLLDGRRWATPVELARLAAVGAAAVVWMPHGRGLVAGVVAVVVVAMAAWLTRVGRRVPEAPGIPAEGRLAAAAGRSDAGV